jgi:hypothetical protein
MIFNIFVAIIGCRFIKKEILKERNKKRKTEMEELKGERGRMIRKKKHNKSRESFIYLFMYLFPYG